jgi:hypothetical protein
MGKDGQGKDGQGKDGQGKDGQAKDGQGKDGQGKDGQAKDGKGKDGQGKGDKLAKSDKEKNDKKGEGNREASSPTPAQASKLGDVTGDGAFMHLPPRQRELIRQAISGNLPPEYANLIQQYYINIARGRPAGALPTPPMPK